MLYNKNKYRKANDKKVLRKVGKQWKVVSIALLMAIGGAGATANLTSANASRVQHRHVHTERTAHVSHKTHKARKSSSHGLTATQRYNKHEFGETNITPKGVNSLEASINSTFPSKAKKAKPKAKKKSAKSKSTNAQLKAISRASAKNFDGMTRRQKKAIKNGNPKAEQASIRAVAKKAHVSPKTLGAMNTNSLKPVNLTWTDQDAKDAVAFGNSTPKKSAKKTAKKATKKASKKKTAKKVAKRATSKKPVSKKARARKSRARKARNTAGATVLANRIKNNVKQVNASSRAQPASSASAKSTTSFNDDVQSWSQLSAEGVNPETARKIQNLELGPNDVMPNDVPSTPASAPSAVQPQSSATPASSAPSSVAPSSVAPSSVAPQSQSVAPASSAKPQSNASSAVSSKATSTASTSANSSKAQSKSVAPASSATSTKSAGQNSLASASQSVHDLIMSLEAKPDVQRAMAKSAKTSHARKATKRAKKAKKINYRHGDNGSAASYYAQVEKDKANYANASAKAQSLTNSTKGKANANALQQSVASAKATVSHDQSLANSYSATAQTTNFSQKVSDVAKKAHDTASYYTESVGANFANNAQEVSEGTDLTNQLNTINSYAQQINTINTNSSASNAQTSKANSANANTQNLLNELNNAKNSLGSLKASNANVAINNSIVNSASVADDIAFVNSSADNAYVNSLGASLGNMDNVHATIHSVAPTFNAKTPTTPNINFRNASNVAVPVSVMPGTSLNRVLSDANAMTIFGNYKAQTTLDTNDAQNNVSRLSADYQTASQQAKITNALANHPTLAVVTANAGGYYKGMELAQGKDANGIQSLANSANASLASAKAHSASYAKATSADFVLAPSLATNYSNRAEANQSKMSSANTDLGNFYSDYLGVDYNNANTQASKAKSALKHDQTFANAYGSHVYNFAPKIVTVQKPVVLHHSAQFHHSARYNKAHGVTMIKPGAELRATGIGFAKDGTTRFVIRNYNHKSGFITANPKYVNNTYLFADRGNHVTVTAIRPIHEHRGVKYSKKNRVRTFKVGTKVSGRVVSEDGAYGGFTRIQLPNGHYVTSNTKYVKLTHANHHVHKKGANGLPSHLVK